jgi:hypothetical protein
MSNIDPLKVQQATDGLVVLAETIKELSKVDRKPDMTLIPNAGISGDKISGGRITKFQSVGIRDDSTRLSVLINDDGLTTDVIDVDTLEGDTIVNGNLTVEGEVHARKLHVDEISADVRNERSSSLEFVGEQTYNKGLVWTGNGQTKQFILRPNPDRLWSSNSIDVASGSSYYINGIEVLNEQELGPSITHSKLRKLGALDKLVVNGDANFSQFIFWNSTSNRLGIGIEEPNAQLSIAGWEQEFVIDVEDRATRLGNHTTHELQIVTDDIPRIIVEASGKVNIGTKDGANGRLSVHGKLGVGINNVPEDVDMAVAGPVRIQGIKHEAGNKAPTSGTYRQGDIVWNTNPKPTGYIGWVCVRDGTPGEWKTFGSISA